MRLQEYLPVQRGIKLRKADNYPISIGERTQELVRNADKAMFEAGQRSGKYCIYSAKTL